MLLLLLAQAHAQSGGPGQGSHPSEVGRIAVAVVFPPDVGNVRLVAQHAAEQDGVLFTDNGSLSFDIYGDGEWWAIVNPTPGDNVLRISGSAAGLDVWHTETVQIPSAWMAWTYPVTLIAHRDDGGWAFTRAFSAAMPAWDGPTGAGLAGKADQIGLSPAVLYLGWGFFLVALLAVSVLRGAILRARGAEET